MKRRGVLLATWACLALGTVALMPAMLNAQESAVEGRLVNGTEGGPVPSGVEVTLHAIGPSREVTIETQLTDDQGGFTFAIGYPEDFTYTLATQYQGVDYGQVLESPLSSDPIEVRVYESTPDASLLWVDSAVMLVKVHDEDERFLSGSEVINLINSGDRTFVPDLTMSSAGGMNFLRFGLPPQALDLTVESDLPGREVINVGSGFALMAPVPPGRHLLGFSYIFPYEGSAIEFTRSFHIDTVTFLLLLPESGGQVRSPDMARVESVDLGGATYKVWAADPQAAGAELDLELAGLLQPPWYRRLGDILFEGRYPKVAILSLLGVVLAALLARGLLAARPGPTPAMEMAAPSGSIGTGERRQSLLEDLADLDETFERSEIAQEEYESRRAALKSALLELDRQRMAP